MPRKKPTKFTFTYYSLLAFSAALYVGLTLFSPIRNNTYNLTSTQLHLIQLSFILPIILIWFLIVFGGVRFKNYAHSITGSEEGKGLGLVANSLLLLGFGGIISSIINLGTNFVPNRQLIEEFAIGRNYLNILIALVSYVVLYVGSRRLLSTVNTKASIQSAKSYLPSVLLVMSVSVYVALMFLNPYRNSTPDPSKISSFYLPDWLLLTTIILPYALIWATATAAIVNLRVVASGVKGIIYQQAMKRLVLGLTLVVSFALALGVLSSLSGLFVGASLQFILVFIYLILIGYAAGFVVIASAARKLSRIEEV